MAYARDVTGVSLDGNAASWWPHAEGRYERGHSPQVGAILVFKPYGRMHVGHVAVVSRVVNSREVLVDQANWVRGRVTTAMSVVDASPLNDWTSVKVQYQGTHGRENPTYGFIYPSAQPDDINKAFAALVPDKARPAEAKHIAAHARHHKDADQQDAAATTDPAPRHMAKQRRHRDGTETAAQTDPAPRHIAERTKHRKDADEQETAAHADPAPHHLAEHTVHHQTHPAHDEAKADQSAEPVQLVAAAKLPVHKHRLPDARLAYVY